MFSLLATQRELSLSGHHSTMVISLVRPGKRVNFNVHLSKTFPKDCPQQYRDSYGRSPAIQRPEGF